MGRAARLKKERKEAPAGITAETLKAKIADLATQQEQAVANLNAMAGAKQAYEMLLADLTPKPKPPLEPADPPKLAQ
jgi:hypothetical protein